MIKINDLSLCNKDNILISKLNIEFNTGNFWAILGKNGTGKTTLLQTMAGLLKYRNGSIKIVGTELNLLTPLIRAQKIAFLSQLLESGLDCTVEQSISYGRYPWHQFKLANKENQALIDSAINAMHLNELRKCSIQNISGGELRKVEIATILAQDSQIMMFDEPLNHLDISFRYKLMELLKQLSNKKLIIIVTHDIQYVQAYCSHVMMLLGEGQTIVGQCKDVINTENLNKMLGITLPKNIYL